MYLLGCSKLAGVEGQSRIEAELCRSQVGMNAEHPLAKSQLRMHQTIVGGLVDHEARKGRAVAFERKVRLINQIDIMHESKDWKLFTIFYNYFWM